MPPLRSAPLRSGASSPVRNADHRSNRSPLYKGSVRPSLSLSHTDIHVHVWITHGSQERQTDSHKSERQSAQMLTLTSHDRQVTVEDEMLGTAVDSEGIRTQSRTLQPHPTTVRSFTRVRDVSFSFSTPRSLHSCSVSRWCNKRHVQQWRQRGKVNGEQSDAGTGEAAAETES